MTKKILIPYFPKGIQYATPLLFIVGIYLIVSGSWIWGALMIILGLVIVTTRYVTEIDLEQRKYRDYLSLLGLTLNEESKRFNKLDRIVVTKGNYSQKINTRVQSRQMDWSDYTATLVFDNDETLDLLTRNSKKELLLGLKDFATFLQVNVQDRTTPQHYWVDLNRVN